MPAYYGLRGRRKIKSIILYGITSFKYGGKELPQKTSELKLYNQTP